MLHCANEAWANKINAIDQHGIAVGTANSLCASVSMFLWGTLLLNATSFLLERKRWQIISGMKTRDEILQQKSEAAGQP